MAAGCFEITSWNVLPDYVHMAKKCLVQIQYVTQTNTDTETNTNTEIQKLWRDSLRIFSENFVLRWDGHGRHRGRSCLTGLTGLTPLWGAEDQKLVLLRSNLGEVLGGRKIF